MPSHTHTGKTVHRIHITQEQSKLPNIFEINYVGTAPGCCSLCMEILQVHDYSNKAQREKHFHFYIKTFHVN